MSGQSRRFADLGTRTLSGAVLGLAALWSLQAGGLASSVFLGLAAAAMGWELARMVGAERSWSLILMALAGFAAVIVTELSLLRWGFALLLAAALVIGAMEPRARLWLCPGLLWIGLAMASVQGLRRDAAYGFEAVLWLFLVVIASDVGGYFGGRLIGGPKLWPRISPKKTWAGTLSGMALAAVVGALFARWTTGTFAGEVASVSALAALVAQAGDMGESAVKRRFGVKDASRLIPGHGGVLDRLDGLMAAALFSAAVTFARGTSVFIW